MPTASLNPALPLAIELGRAALDAAGLDRMPVSIRLPVALRASPDAQAEILLGHLWTRHPAMRFELAELAGALDAARHAAP